MPLMAPTTHLDVLDAAEHLPGGSTLVVNDFTWEEYELLIQDLDGRHNPRLSYDSGRLEVVSIFPGHEGYDRMVDAFVREFCEARGMEVEAYGQATWKLKSARKGAEADCCYYVQNARKVFGKQQIPLESNPPPDLVVEIDLTTDSIRKLRIYAGLRVPEVWIFDGKVFHFHELQDGKYVEIPISIQLPGLQGQMMIDALSIVESQGQQAAIKKFRRLIGKPRK